MDKVYFTGSYLGGIPKIYSGSGRNGRVVVHYSGTRYSCIEYGLLVKIEVFIKTLIRTTGELSGGDIAVCVN